MLPGKCFKLLFSLSIVLCQYVLAEDFYCKVPQGFMWYTEDPVAPKADQSLETPQPITIQQTASTQSIEASKRNQALKQKLEDAIQVMLDNPTLDNAVIAQRMQKKVMDRSDAVAKSWVLASLVDAGLITPETNPNVLHRELARKEKETKDTDQLNAIAQEWGLFFYVMEQCTYCQRFAPIVKEIQAEAGFQVLAVSHTGTHYAGFEGRKDTGFLDHLNPERVAPILYLVHKDGKRIYPVARGLTDAERVKANILMIHKLDLKNRQQP